MADQADIETLLVDLAAAALYPSGSAMPSAIGPICRIYRGWPTAAALDADLAAGGVNVSVYPIDAGGRTTTRYPDTWFPSTAPVPSLQVTVAGLAARFSGTAAAGQVAGLAVDGRSYVYRVQSDDTPALVAGGVAALARADAIVLQAGATITIPGAFRLLARVVADTQAQQEVRRQVKDFRITCWCPTPSLRDAAAATIDLSLATRRFLGLPDGTTARLLFGGSSVVDRAENAALYRRDLIYSVEYPTVLTQMQPAMLFGSGTLGAVRFLG